MLKKAHVRVYQSDESRILRRLPAGKRTFATLDVSKAVEAYIATLVDLKTAILGDATLNIGIHVLALNSEVMQIEADVAAISTC
jgi:hypothetical protein